jgi:hypothetical protein
MSEDIPRLISILVLMMFLLFQTSTCEAAPFLDVETFSVISDSQGDCNVDYIDVFLVSVAQLNGDKLMFSVEVQDDVPETLDHYVEYCWVLDTDMDESTGQEHLFVGSEYNVRVAYVNGGWNGFIDDIRHMVSVRCNDYYIQGNKVSIIVDRSQISAPEAFRWEFESWSISDEEEYDVTDGSSEFQVVHGMDYLVIVFPSVNKITSGESPKLPTVILTDNFGETINKSIDDIRFVCLDTLEEMNQTDLEKIYSGSLEVMPVINGTYFFNTVKYFYEEHQLLPPIMFIPPFSENDQNFSFETVFWNGSHILNKGEVISWVFPNNALEIDSRGYVSSKGITPNYMDIFYVYAALNGAIAGNSVQVRVSDDVPDVEFTYYSGEHVSFYVPSVFREYEFEKILTNMDGLNVADLAFSVLLNATGVYPWEGSKQFIVLDFWRDSSCWIGLAGNPIRFGYDLDSDFCSLAHKEGLNWDMLFHELAHNFKTPLRSELNKANSELTEEMLANMYGLFLNDYLTHNSEKYAIKDSAVLEMNDQHDSLLEYLKSEYDSYLNAGCDYRRINQDSLAYMIWTLNEEYGPNFLLRYLLTLHQDVTVYSSIDTPEKQATFIVAQCSVAAGADLRNIFKDTWRFPVNDTYYEEVVVYLENYLDIFVNRLKVVPLFPPEIVKESVSEPESEHDQKTELVSDISPIGIPSFPLLSIIIGLLVSAFVMRRRYIKHH